MFGLDVGFIAAASMKSDGKLSESAARAIRHASILKGLPS
jgi:hypothetical protein